MRNQTNPANFYGWFESDFTARVTSRARYFANGAQYADLCGDAALFLDSFLQVGADCGRVLAGIPFLVLAEGAASDLGLAAHPLPGGLQLVAYDMSAAHMSVPRLPSLDCIDLLAATY